MTKAIQNYYISAGRENKMYTLWYTGANYEGFIKNLSVDLETAKQKAKQYLIDRGSYYGDSQEEIPVLADELDGIVRGKDVIRFGKYQDHRVSQVPSGYLKWLYFSEGRVERLHDYDLYFCRKGEDLHNEVEKELLNRGELVEYNGKLVTPRTRQQMIEDQKAKGHHEEHGKRVTLALRVHRLSFFEGFYGKQIVIIFRDSDNREFTYLGSASSGFSLGASITYGRKTDFIEYEIEPEDFIDGDVWINVTFTVEHTEYRGDDQTKMKRPKLKESYSFLLDEKGE